MAKRKNKTVETVMKSAKKAYAVEVVCLVSDSLYGRMLSSSVLCNSFFKVKSANGAVGIDGQSVKDFAESLGANVTQLLTELQDSWHVVSKEFYLVAEKLGEFVDFFFEDEFVWGRRPYFSAAVIDGALIERRIIPILKSLSMSVR